MKKKYLFLPIFGLILACSDPVTRKEIKSPDDEFGELFKDVQLKNVFPASKTFADCTPKYAADSILKIYADQKTQPNFDLKKFVETNFILPKINENSSKTNPNLTAEQHINEQWLVLTRQPQSGGTLIPFRKAYLVADGRFQEAYYWESYFVMLGLQAAKKDTLMKNMVLNYAQIIQDFGHIPSGNRSYFLSRSQPPFFALMVKLLAETTGKKEVLRNYLPQLQKEYQYWMAAETPEMIAKANENKQKGEKSYLKTVFLDKNEILNRYYDFRDSPRPEAYREDVKIAQKSGRKATEIYRDLRSAAESGWDFSSRWLRDEKSLESVHTTEILPVDLNALLYNLELTLAEAYDLADKKKYAESFRNLADLRKKAFNKYFWNEAAGFYFDYDFVAKKPTNVYSLAAVYPLFFKLASPEQAQKVAKILEEKFLKSGGLTTTLSKSGQDFDAPNGIAPLQWMAIQGLRNYGMNDLANKIKQNWVQNNLKFYKKTGKLAKKYNVFEPEKADSTQADYGWSNGVLLKLLSGH